MKILKLREFKKKEYAYSKLFKLHMDKIRDISKWRKKLFQDICPGSTKICPWPEAPVNNLDHLFSFGKSRKALWKYCYTSFAANSETAMNYLATFDTMIAKVVYSFLYNFGTIRSQKSNKDKMLVIGGEEDCHMQNQILKPYSRIRKSGTITHENDI